MTPDQRELREERQAICEADHIPQSEIERIFDAYPSIYGIQRIEYSLETIIGRRVIQGQPQDKKTV